MLLFLFIYQHFCRCIMLDLPRFSLTILLLEIFWRIHLLNYGYLITNLTSIDSYVFHELKIAIQQPLFFTQSEYIVVGQSPSHVQLFTTPRTAACQASLSLTISWSLPQFMSIESVMQSNHPIPCHPFLHLPPIFPSIRVFSSESALLIRWPKYQNFSFNISLFSEYSGLTSFKIDWFDLLAFHGLCLMAKVLLFCLASLFSFFFCIFSFL